MHYKTQWFLRKQYLGEGTASLCGRTFHIPYSQLYFCWRCGDTWARMIVTPATEWVVERRLCSKCGGFDLVGLYEEEYTMPYDALVHDLIASEKCTDYMSHLLTGGK